MPNWLASLIGLMVDRCRDADRVPHHRRPDRRRHRRRTGLCGARTTLVGSLFAWLGRDVASGLVAAFEDIDLAANIRALAGSAGYILATAILIVLYVGFLFAERARFAGKLARLFPDPRRAARVDRMFQSITRTVHRYIVIKTVVSILTGVLVYIVMVAFGLEFAETWALLTVFLNFIPNIGSIIATAIPTLAALVQFDNWTPVLLLFAIIGVIQFSVGNLIEPHLMGRSLNLSPFVIILSLTFWGAIWGIVGMFLAVPIMVMVMIVCSHVPLLHPVAIVLSRDGASPLASIPAASDSPPPNRIRTCHGIALASVHVIRKRRSPASPAGIRNSAPAQISAMPGSLKPSSPGKRFSSGRIIQSSAAAKKTMATRFSGTVIDPNDDSPPVTTPLCNDPAISSLKGKITLVSRSHASGRKTMTSGMAIADHAAKDRSMS
jgi:hypothetical protein